MHIVEGCAWVFMGKSWNILQLGAGMKDKRGYGGGNPYKDLILGKSCCGFFTS